MTSPTTTLYQIDLKNPHASMALTLPVEVVCNTPDGTLLHNVKINSERLEPWIGMQPAHDKVAILVGGGPSLADSLSDIMDLRGTVFAMNGAASYLNDHGIRPDIQVIADAKRETSQLIEPRALRHLFASQVDPWCFEVAESLGLWVKVWHLHMDGMEEVFPEERRRVGGYALVGGGASVGNSALCLAYVLGYRKMHLFGYDSSNRGDATHAYDQPMNRYIPNIKVEWAGKTFTSSVAMKSQAEKFMMTGQSLRQAGVEITVHGDGLLPTMWNTPVGQLSERNKYSLLWQTDSYREYSPGEQLVSTFLHAVAPERAPDGLIIDFGCGTGRAALELAKRGYPVYCIDFAANCRDQEAMCLPFLEWDLTVPIPARANYGLCTDVMEHIPPEDVDRVICNIMEAAKTVMFQVATVPDVHGALIGTPLHLTVKDHRWWLNEFRSLGFDVTNDVEREASSLFLVTRKD